MSEEIKQESMVTVIDKEEAVPQKPEQPTREQLREKGWSKAEMDEAEKRGMIEKPEEAKKKDSTPPAKEGEQDEQKAPEGEEKRQPTFLDDMDREMTPAQEKVFLETFGPGTKPRAFYFRAKNERIARQRAEQERDKLALELRLSKDAREREEGVQETDAEGNLIDPEDKPLTMKQLKAMQAAENERLTKERAELQERSAASADALQAQEEFAKSSLPDYDDTVRLATDLVKNFEAIPEKWKRDKVAKLFGELRAMAANADKYGVDDYNAAMISYELGQLHPNYGRKADKDGPPNKDPKANGSLTPEQMERIKENAQRRASSASVGKSGGSRTLSAEDVTIKDVVSMSRSEREKFAKEHPERMKKLLRG